jgi:hypothetical protein
MCPEGRSESSTSSSNSEGVIELGFEVVIVCLLCGSVLGMDLLVSVVVGLRRKGNIRSLHQALFSDRAYGFEV